MRRKAAHRTTTSRTPRAAANRGIEKGALHRNALGCGRFVHAAFREMFCCVCSVSSKRGKTVGDSKIVPH